MLPYNDFAANGNNPLNSVSQLKGALQEIRLPRSSSAWAGVFDWSSTVVRELIILSTSLSGELFQPCGDPKKIPAQAELERGTLGSRDGRLTLL